MIHYSLKPADPFEIPNVTELYESCKLSLLEGGLQQWGAWDDGYPGISFIRDAVNRKEMHILTISGQEAGAVVINEKQSAEWSGIKWSAQSQNPAVIHALVISPSFQGRGLSKILLGWCEEYACSAGYDSIRLDSFEKNPVSNSLYRRSGYKAVGTVIFETKPANNRVYICYEKQIAGGNDE